MSEKVVTDYYNDYGHYRSHSPPSVTKYFEFPLGLPPLDQGASNLAALNFIPTIVSCLANALSDLRISNLVSTHRLIPLR